MKQLHARVKNEQWDCSAPPPLSHGFPERNLDSHGSRLYMCLAGGGWATDRLHEAHCDIVLSHHILWHAYIQQLCSIQGSAADVHPWEVSENRRHAVPRAVMKTRAHVC